MEDLLSKALEGGLALDKTGQAMLDPSGGANALIFLLIAAAGLAMALVYIPLRLYLTITARSRRLRLLLRIRKLREDLGQSLVVP
jgi:hypothetical protein